MITRRTALALLGSAAGSTLLPLKASAASDREPPYLQPLIEAGKIPELAQRLPYKPRVVNLAGMGREAGKHGGVIRTLIGGQKDIRMMTINGYARLVGYDEKLNFQPDILESVEPVEDRIYTFRIRDGHKWSDGELLTPEDFRYMWEDVLSNEDLAPGGYDPSLLVNGKPPVFEVVDRLTVRYTWEGPNPDFLPMLAAAQPISLALPAHYMKQFHKKYQDGDKLDKLVKDNEVKNWKSLHIKMARQYRPENPDLPTLDPWRNTTPPPAEQFVFERNPFFHRVDENGLQLPYFDKFLLNVSSSAIVPAKTGAGESDLQFTGIDFSDYTFLKDAERRFPVKVGLWKRTQGSRIALLPNLNVGDDVWRKVLQDVRVRRALSLAIDRREINLAVFYGLAKESADTVLPESPLFKEEYQHAWIAHDPVKANQLLDEAGLAERGDDGVRLLPDGRPAQVVVETAGESTLETDVLELVTDHWNNIGISLFIRTSQRDVFRSRAIGGQIMMAVWNGLDNGVPTADMNPGQLAPTSDSQLQWPVWGLHFMSNGEKGSAPDLPEAARQVELLGKWRSSTTLEARSAAWQEMLHTFTDQVFSIGIVNQALQPVLSARRMRNIPEAGLYGFEPTAFLGVYMPDTFWLGAEEA
jgi:peptide/nickel transport system substrate-binding protein